MAPRTRNLLRGFLTTATVLSAMGSGKLEAEASGTGWPKTPLTSNYITVVENSNLGTLAGEYDTRLWLNPFNGVYISKDLGKTWSTLGLGETGITDLKYFNKKIYASTYYKNNNTVGLFVYNGSNWSHIGPNFSASTVDKDSHTIYLGGYSNGLWISTDDGINWQQKMGTGWYGPNITVIKSTENITLVSDTSKTYKTLDHGQTWVEVLDLANLTTKSFSINGNIILAATTTGTYKSSNLGGTWTKIGNHEANSTLFYDGKFYLGRIDNQNINSVYESFDFGLTWTNTNLNLASYKKIIDLVWVYSEPSFIFAVAASDGIYKYEIPPKTPESFPFLDPPWQTVNNNEFVDKITSYFDHSYPLLGYSFYQEPQEEINTTVNFFGYREKEPSMYYSSHNGTDYALSYGTEIRAPAAGYASYYYYKACGHTIKIDHQNGYQTTFMHLQKEGLVTYNLPVWVNKGNVIGKVGMTGNTTGPHLHFGVTKDANANSNFVDDFPNGNVDPYGWLIFKTDDPWPEFNWTDTLGSHTGTKSVYLWNIKNSETAKFLTSSENVIQFENKTILISTSPSNLGFTISIKNLGLPKVFPSQGELKYLPNTSVLLEALDQTKDYIFNFSNPIEIKMSLLGVDTANVSLDSIKLYFLNEITNLWEALPTVLDLVENTVTAHTTHLSQFAAFGEKIDVTPPQTEMVIEGSAPNGRYIQYPQISFQTESNAQVFYTIDDENTWEIYSSPFVLNKEGVTNILYRSQDMVGNLEETKNIVVKIDTQNKMQKKLKVLNSRFQTIL